MSTTPSQRKVGDVQGGGCATVGVAGLIQSGGFGSFSKRYGLAAAGLLEAEIVTADGVVRIANEYSYPDLFWALKGGGGGTFGVVTRLTLATHELPTTLGDIGIKIKAKSDAAFHALLRTFVRFYAEKLFNSHWGENINIRQSNVLEANMVFQDVEKVDAAATWKAFLDEVTLSPDLSLASTFFIETMPARKWWDVDYLQSFSKGSVLVDTRPGAPKSHAWWTGDNEQVGEFVHAYKSAWLPAALLTKDRRTELAAALFAASRHWTVGLHCNKGLAGAPAEVRTAARNAPINPSVLDAFALAIIGSGAPPDYGNGTARDSQATDAAEAENRTRLAMAELRRIAPVSGSYIAEGDYFEADWQTSHWGIHYRRLRAIKSKYDPDGLFYVHHGVGSEDWKDNGFTRA